ncbi:MAG: hypothetical protein GEV03_18735 [Streptosporangiales bacterium]|nr:hypothetical protein [Streptosporangiales bacterium]
MNGHEGLAAGFEAHRDHLRGVAYRMLGSLDEAERLTPAERVAFVLHDLSAVPFDEIAIVLGRSQVASKKLASRARDRVRGVATAGKRVDLARHYAVVDAVADETRLFAHRARSAEVALVDGTPGIVVAPYGRLFAVLRLTIEHGRVTEIEVIANPTRLDQLPLAVGRP